MAELRHVQNYRGPHPEGLIWDSLCLYITMEFYYILLLSGVPSDYTEYSKSIWEKNLILMYEVDTRTLRSFSHIYCIQGTTKDK